MPQRTQLVTLATRGQVMLERYKQGVIDDVAKILVEADAVIRKRLSVPQTENNRARMNAMLAVIAQELTAIYAKAGERITEGARDAGLAQAEAEARSITSVIASDFPDVRIDVPTGPQIYAAAVERPFTIGKTPQMLEPFVKKWVSGSVESADTTIRLGFLQGRTNQQIVQDLRGTKAAGYKDGVIGTHMKNAQMVVRTSVQHVAQVARMETMKLNADIVEEYEWVSVLDDRTTDICQALSGQTFPMGKGPLPPAHIGCLTGDSLITSCSDITGASKRQFDGEVCTIKTAKNRIITCTPNHPILTARGWVAAGLIDVGDKVVCKTGGKVGSLDDANHNDVKATISDIAESFFAHSRVMPVPVPTASPDFHGDGAGSDVAVVGANRSLLAERDSSIGKCRRDGGLVSGGKRALCFRSFDQLRGGVFLAASRIVGRFCNGSNFLRSRLSHAGILLLASVSRFSPALLNKAFNYFRAGAERFCYSSNTKSSVEKPDGFVTVYSGHGSFRFRFYDNAASMQLSVDWRPSDAESASDIINGKAGQVELDCVVENRRAGFSGHVFNLETVDGYYCSSGIVTHNCRSTTVAVLDKAFDVLDKGATQFSRGADGKQQVDAGLSYYEWLKTQPESFQDAAIGPMRGALLRDGGLSADRFAELQLNKNFQPITLEQMKELDPVAFDKAGIKITESGRAVWQK